MKACASGIAYSVAADMLTREAVADQECDAAGPGPFDSEADVADQPLGFGMR